MTTPTNFVPEGSDKWSDEQWAIFRRCYPEPSGDFSFDGDNDCNDGSGDCSWSGESRRCECGNRRLYWCFEGDFVFPEVF